MSPWDVLGWMAVGIVGFMIVVFLLFLLAGIFSALGKEVSMWRMQRHTRERAARRLAEYQEARGQRQEQAP